jgi:predicted MPP superfamily phosphohydrolase
LNAEDQINSSDSRSPEEAQSPVSKSLRRRLRPLLAIPAVLGVFGQCYVYGRLIEVDWVKVEHVDIPIRNLPEEFDGFKVVHLSDLHIDEIGKREKKLAEMVNSVGADAIVITGDCAQSREGEQIAATLISQFKAERGLWGVLGNWDSNETAKTLEEVGIEILEAETDTITIDGQRLCIIGLRLEDALPFYSTEQQREIIAELKAKLPEGAPVILLSHMPRVIRAAREEEIDLVLAGHTHGGQVRIPFGPAIVTLSDLGVWTSKGLYEFDDTYLHISPGFGLEPGPDWIQVRFWCRPEVTVITLRAEEG